MTDTEVFKSLLLRRKAALTERIEGANKELSAPHSKDWDDQAIEREQEEVVEALSEADRSELRGIEAALTRIREHSFGECASCGDPISEARLLTLSATPFCRRCARQDEFDLFENVPV